MKKTVMTMLLVMTALALVVALSACSGSTTPSTTGTQPAASSTATGTPAGNPLLTNVQLSDIAPGLGTVMVEVGYRNWYLPYAARGGNWDLAAYQAKEIGEIMEVGETTRPKRKAGLTKFTDGPLKAVNDAVAAKDISAFETAWTAEVKGCNDCHDEQGFKYIQWELPPTAPTDLKLTAP